jgi:hypothetical protein
MGNCCGKPDEPESGNFSGPGRRLDSARPQAPTTAPVPSNIGGPPRPVGAAGDAAEARAKAAPKKVGPLQAKLNAQKKQTRSDTLNDSSNQERRARDAEEAAEFRNWN